MEGYSDWEKISKGVLGSRCSIVDEDSQFNYGIYTNAISFGIVASRTFFSLNFATVYGGACKIWGILLFASRYMCTILAFLFLIGYNLVT